MLLKNTGIKWKMPLGSTSLLNQPYHDSDDLQHIPLKTVHTQSSKHVPPDTSHTLYARDIDDNNLLELVKSPKKKSVTKKNSNSSDVYFSSKILVEKSVRSH